MPGVDELVIISENEPAAKSEDGKEAAAASGAPSNAPATKSEVGKEAAAASDAPSEPRRLTRVDRVLGATKAVSVRILRRAAGILRASGQIFKVGAIKRGWQAMAAGVIDANLKLLGKLRGRAAEPEADGDRKDPIRRGNAREAKDARETIASQIRDRAKDVEVASAAVKAPVSRLRLTLIVLLFTVLGTIAGMLFSFALFSTMVANQAVRIDEQLDELVALGKQYEKSKTATAQLRNANQDLTRQLEEAEQALARLEASRAASAPAEPEEARRGGPQRLSGRPAGPAERGAAKDCIVGQDGIGKDLSKCIKKFNGE